VFIAYNNSYMAHGNLNCFCCHPICLIHTHSQANCDSWALICHLKVNVNKKRRSGFHYCGIS